MRLVARELVGRWDQLSSLDGELTRVRRDGLGVVLLSGDPGIGKSILVRRFIQEAREHGAEALLAECAKEDALLPLAPLRQISALGNVAVGREVPGRSIDEVERHRLFSSIAGTLRERARQQPIVLVVEDMQWADAETLSLLPYLTRRVADIALLAILTFRSDDAVALPLVDTLGELRQRGAKTVHVPPLTPDQVGTLARRIVGSVPAPDVRAFLVERSGGNPLFAEELVSALAQSGLLTISAGLWTAVRPLDDVVLPTTVTAGVRARSDALPVDVRKALSIAAIIGQRFDLGLLTDVTGAERDAMLAALHAGIDARLIDEGTGERDTFGFRHALFRDALIEHLLGAERRELHGAIALAIERRTSDADLPAVAEALAYHFEAAGITDRALRYHMMVVRAAPHGADLGYLFPMRSNEGVARHLEHSLALAPEDDPDRAEMLRLFAWAQPDPVLRVPLLEKSLEQAMRMRDARGEAIATVMLGVWRGLQGDGRAIAVIREGVAELGRLGLHAEVAGATHQLARVATLGMDMDAVPLAQRAVEVARAEGEAVLLANALITLGTATSDRDEGLALIRSGIAAAREHSASLIEGRGLTNLWTGLFAWGSGLPETSRVHELDQVEAEVVRVIAREGGSLNVNQFELRLLQMFFRARWDAAADLIAEMAFHPFIDSTVATMIGAYIRVARDGPGDEIETVRHAHERIAATIPLNRLVLAPEILYLAGRPNEALAAASMLRDGRSRPGSQSYPHVALLHDNPAAVVALAAAHDLADRSAFDEWLEFGMSSELSPTVTALGRIEYVRAESALRKGRLEEAQASFARSAEAFERRGGTPLSRTLPRLRRAELLTERDPTAAQHELAQVISMWRELQAKWYLGRLREWSDAHGLRGWTVSARRGPRLTPRELEVARNVAEGFTNKEIAAALGITERTAETHVQRILTKLDLRSRTQLAAWVGGGQPART